MTYQYLKGITPAIAGPHLYNLTPPLQKILPISAPEIGGIYGWLTPVIAGIAEINTEFARRVLSISRNEQHFIAMCYVLMNECQLPPTEETLRSEKFHSFARGYGSLSRRVLLEISNPDTSPKFAKLTQKFAGAIWQPITYRRLARLCDDDECYKTLSHLPSIARRQILTLGRLPQGYRNRATLRLIHKPEDLVKVIFAINLAMQLRPELDHAQLTASLNKAESGNIRDWVMRHARKAPFPSAPVSAIDLNGIEAIRPLTSYSDLKRAALEFDNCIRTYQWAVMREQSYFYRYAPKAEAKGIAIIELRKVPLLGWVVHEALGEKNEPISAIDRAIILRAFQEFGITAAPQAAHPDAWFDLE